MQVTGGVRLPGHDKAGVGRSLGSSLAGNGDEGALGYICASGGGRLSINRRTANAFARKRWLDPHRKGYVPFYCGSLADWPQLHEEMAEPRNPAMEMEQGHAKQLLEEKDALAARLKRSPDLLDALLMTFTHFE